LAFIIKLYHDAQSSECQMSKYFPLNVYTHKYSICYCHRSYEISQFLTGIAAVTRAVSVGSFPLTMNISLSESKPNDMN